MKRKKILFAAVDIGYRIEHYTKFINEYHVDKLQAESFSKYVLPKEHYKTKYTYTCPINKTHPIIFYAYCFCFFVFALFKYDIFHFISGETILTRKLRPVEFFIYKLFRKKIIMQFVGADIRSVHYQKWKSDNIISYIQGEDLKDKTSPWQKKLIADSLKYASHILVSTPDLLEIIPSASYYPVVIDVEKFITELNENKSFNETHLEITILHCPSNILYKGTSYIHASLDRVAKASKHPLKLVIPTQKKNKDGTVYLTDRYELFTLFQEADIIIDQLVTGWYGLQSVEALLAGKEVICYVDEKLKPYLYPDCPIHIADAKKIDAVINNCIENVVKNGKPTYKQKQIEWVKKYHTIENNHQGLLNAWGITN